MGYVCEEWSGDDHLSRSVVAWRQMNVLANPVGTAEIGGIVAFSMAVVELIKFLVSKVISAQQKSAATDRAKATEEKLVKISKQVDELHAWHDIVDDEGVKIWYVRRSLEEAISKLHTSIDKQTEVLANMVRGQQSIVDTLVRLDKNIERMTRVQA